LKNSKIKYLPSVLILIFLIFISTNLISKDTNEFYDPARDSLSYLSLAESIDKYNKFERLEYLGQGTETIRTPIYPLLLSLFLNNLKTIILIQSLLHVCSSLILLHMVKKITSQFVSVFVFFLFLFNPVLVSISQLLITESISIFLLSTSLYVLLEKNNKFLFCLICGILPLVRPAFIVVAFGFLIFMKVFNKDLSLKKFIVLSLLLILPSLGWTIRNYLQTDMFIFSSLSSMNLLEETASGIMSINEDFEGGETIFEIINIEYEERRKWSQILRNEVNLGDLSRVIANAPGPNPHIVTSEYQKYALNVIKDNKIELVVLGSRSLIYVLFEPGDHLVEYVFKVDNLTLYRYVFTFLNLFIILLSYKNIIQSTFNNKKIDTLILFYLLLLTPLLLLSTPHARFGSILIFFHLLFFSKEVSKKPYFQR